MNLNMNNCLKISIARLVIDADEAVLNDEASATARLFDFVETRDFGCELLQRHPNGNTISWIYDYCAKNNLMDLVLELEPKVDEHFRAFRFVVQRSNRKMADYLLPFAFSDVASTRNQWSTKDQEAIILLRAQGWFDLANMFSQRLKQVSVYN